MIMSETNNEAAVVKVDKEAQDNHNDGRPKYLSFPDLQSTFERNSKLPDKTMTLLKETIAQIAVSTSK